MYKKRSAVCGPYLLTSAGEEVDQTSAVCKEKSACFFILQKPLHPHPNQSTTTVHSSLLSAFIPTQISPPPPSHPHCRHPSTTTVPPPLPTSFHHHHLPFNFLSLNRPPPLIEQFNNQIHQNTNLRPEQT
ncbi:hypothetical protein HanRHA438_Chr14g0679401 [Helianthus annuus]|nr:hypothetical protein HanRHA438_Chr14g0679401 [Helianthus annuus]